MIPEFFVNLLKKVIRLTISIFVIALLSTSISGQSVSTTTQNARIHRIMFYNVENFFDAETDTSLSYNEFTPEGNLHWTTRKVEAKRKALYKVITAVGEWSSPTIIGMVEVENETVLQDLLHQTPLGRKGYKIIHFDSPDFRGIDAAMLYSPDFNLIAAHPVKIIDPQDPDFTTRDMLYVKGLLETDTFHIIVNHWTSRYRGLLESNPKRLLQSELLLRLTDSICAINPNANLILMGDFNDSPNNESMVNLVENGRLCKLINLPLKISNNEVKGTLKYQGKWDIFDQLLVSQNLVSKSSAIQVMDSTGHVFSADFILEKDNKFGGSKPFRTNVGFTYHGGFSDHLPVFIDLKSYP
jgi:predicted extracellular nuclease